VVAGLITGSRAPRVLSPEHRLSDSQNWRTVELVLEGMIFLTMGLELFGIVQKVQNDHSGVLPAVGIAAAALLLTIVVRAAFVAPLLALLARRSRRRERMRPTLTKLQKRLEDPEAARRLLEQGPPPPDALPELQQGVDPAADPDAHAEVLAADPSAAHAEVAKVAGVQDAAAVTRDRLVRPSGWRARLIRRQGRKRRAWTVENITRFGTRLRRVLADIDYFTGAPLGWREGTIVVWAGMRGAVTVAAAQSLPSDTPGRSVLVLIAFLVAAGSLLLQGGTLGLALRVVKPTASDPKAEKEERKRLLELLHEAGQAVPQPQTTERTPEAFNQHKAARLQRIRAQRDALLDARDDGTFSADVLAGALSNLDADEISIDLKGDPTEATG
jgi:CPA1 family monovalent cation:H+ antiporter